MKQLLIGTFFTGMALAQSCEMEDPLKIDCGFMGIDQTQCEAKGCCWKPTNQLGGTPWCFYASGKNPC